MSNLDDLLDRAMSELSADAPHEPDLAGQVRRRSRWRRAVAVAPIAAAIAVVAVVTTVFLTRPAGPAPGAGQPASACTDLRPALLPTWARVGFSDPEPEMPFVTSRSGAMVAIVFAQPLVSPTLPDRGNKILWVTNDPASAGDTLQISGTVEGGTQTMTTTVPGGPGPSGIDVPVPGCWHFALTWGTHTDSVDLRYVDPSTLPAGSR